MTRQEITDAICRLLRFVCRSGARTPVWDGGLWDEGNWDEAA